MNTPITPSLQLGMIGNCAYSALIDRQARLVWCCLPRFDGDPVFNALLDPSDNGSLYQRGKLREAGLPTTGADQHQYGRYLNGTALADLIALSAGEIEPDFLPPLENGNA